MEDRKSSSEQVGTIGAINWCWGLCGNIFFSVYTPGSNMLQKEQNTFFYLVTSKSNNGSSFTHKVYTYHVVRTTSRIQGAPRSISAASQVWFQWNKTCGAGTGQTILVFSWFAVVHACYWKTMTVTPTANPWWTACMHRGKDGSSSSPVVMSLDGWTQSGSWGVTDQSQVVLLHFKWQMHDRLRTGCFTWIAFKRSKNVGQQKRMKEWCCLFLITTSN